MGYLTLFITIPLTLFVLLFAASNTSVVPVSLWPLDDVLTIPLSTIGIGLLCAGFIAGAVFVFLYAQKIRLRWWQEKRKNRQLEKDIENLRKKLEMPEQA